jgi:hypothetical protein
LVISRRFHLLLELLSGYPPFFVGQPVEPLSLGGNTGLGGFIFIEGITCPLVDVGVRSSDFRCFLHLERTGFEFSTGCFLTSSDIGGLCSGIVENPVDLCQTVGFLYSPNILRVVVCLEQFLRGFVLGTLQKRTDIGGRNHLPARVIFSLETSTSLESENGHLLHTLLGCKDESCVISGHSGALCEFNSIVGKTLFSVEFGNLLRPSLVRLLTSFAFLFLCTHYFLNQFVLV